MYDLRWERDLHTGLGRPALWFAGGGRERGRVELCIPEGFSVPQ